MISSILPSIISTTGTVALTPSAAATVSGPNFLDMVNSALQNVSATQGNAASAAAGYAGRVPGATLGNALVTNDRAELAWNATVAVRNEVVSAYQSIMNMQF